jgi:hypothetical protein
MTTSYCTHLVLQSAAGLGYCGTLGLEDQLQLLVPECIRDCIAGGVKVRLRAQQLAAILASRELRLVLKFCMILIFC